MSDKVCLLRRILIFLAGSLLVLLSGCEFYSWTVEQVYVGAENSTSFDISDVVVTYDFKGEPHTVMVGTVPANTNLTRVSDGLLDADPGLSENNRFGALIGVSFSAEVPDGVGGFTPVTVADLQILDQSGSDAYMLFQARSDANRIMHLFFFVTDDPSTPVDVRVSMRYEPIN